MQDCAPVSTSLVAMSQLSTSQLPSSPKEIKEYKIYADGFNYLEIIGNILYIIQTHPDIQYVIGILAQFGSNPKKLDLEALKHVICYLKSTTYFKLQLSGNHGTEDTTDLVG